MRRRAVAEGAGLAALLLLLLVTIVYPLLSLLGGALLDGGRPTTWPLVAVLASPPVRRAVALTLLAGVLAAAIGSVIALPLALLTARRRFAGRGLVTVLALLPLVLPPFVGAVAFQQLRLLLRSAGVDVSLVDGLGGVVLAQSLHFFPLVWLGTRAGLLGLHRSLEEAAVNLGASGFRLFRRVLLPLAWRGYAAGALLAFVGVIDDLGTPLVLGYPDLLAPLAYARVTASGPADAAGCAICLILVALSVGACWLARVAAGGRIEPAALGRGEGAPTRALGAPGLVLTWLLVALLLGPALLPFAAIALLSVAEAWSRSPLPTAYTLAGYEQILVRAPGALVNTVWYATLAALVDVALGAAIAWLLLRGRLSGRRWVGALATLPFAIPGVAVALGSLRAFGGLRLPGVGEPLAATWLILIVVYAVRRLPYAVRGLQAALGPLTPALEEAAVNLGATPRRAFVRIVLPLASGGLAAAGLLAFIGSAADFSATLLLVPRVDLGPLTYAVFTSIQAATGRGAGAALGVVAVLLVAAGTWAAATLARRSGPARLRS